MGKFILKKTEQRGDTIVEVLLAIAIAAFAIGVSYATAQRSLQQSITAREHNEALNLAENQIADLKLRFQQTATSTFNTTFANQNHFCLDDLSTGPSDSVHNWGIYQNWNNPGLDLSSPLVSSLSPDVSHPYYYNSGGSPPYGCQHQRTGEGATYYTDITTSSAGGGVNSTIYSIAVRWERLGGGQHNQVTLNYKLNGGGAATLGAVTPPGGFNPPSTALTVDLAVMQWPSFNNPPRLVGSENGFSYLDCTFHPNGVGDNCPGYAGNYDCSTQVPGTNFTQVGVGGKWDPQEVCSVYHATWLVPADETTLKNLDFEFTNDCWYFGGSSGVCTRSGPYNGAEDDNILVFGLSIPAPHVLNFANYCQVTPSPSLPPAGQPISNTNILPLYWGGYTAHLVVDSNPPDGAACT